MDHTVLNTEFAKVATAKVTSAEVQMMNVSEDRLVDELMKQKVGVVRKLCKACNIDSKGSRMDLISRLRAEMQNRQSYDKMFQKIWGASGGWSVIICPHGVVYSIKFNLRAESPRDFADLLLSWKHIPNVSVYDFARGLATHGNLRVPTAIPFHPHEGRLAEPTPENISSAKQGKLKVSLPWLFEKTDNLNSKGNPITGSSEHYVLYDKLHESNTRDPQDVLRRISLVPELRHGKVFAHFTEESKAVLRGDWQPVLRLRKRKLEDTFQNRLMGDLKEASKWCLEQSSVLLDSVQLPKVLCMEDEYVDEALDKLQKAEFSEDRIVALEPFSFFFTEMKDMNLFLEHA
ncbi:uncharacterized protein LOC107701863 [Sinocyclocheilus anshuiensis]|uniref:uncharacterized protein LOC107701863 n=1 Tax=Sinocyclocheilus anshuiensis TaxID=1608454 RepID=UPI0007B91305|nr:PREDICTED: uncharacterized protein LOC107701863 [Sinocyclocheilus anshuiensis]